MGQPSRASWRLFPRRKSEEKRPFRIAWPWRKRPKPQPKPLDLVRQVRARVRVTLTLTLTLPLTLTRSLTLTLTLRQDLLQPGDAASAQGAAADNHG